MVCVVVDETEVAELFEWHTLKDTRGVAVKCTPGETFPAKREDFKRDAPVKMI